MLSADSLSILHLLHEKLKVARMSLGKEQQKGRKVVFPFALNTDL